MSIDSITHVPLTALASTEREAELVRRIAVQDRAALKELYVLYHRRLWRFLMRMMSRHDLAEEVINDTMLTVWMTASKFRGDSRVSTWIVGIAYRRALKGLRRDRRPMTNIEEAGDLVATDEQARRDDIEWIDRALEELPVEQRHALELAYVLGHSCEEIAEVMQCSVNTVKTRLFHARRKLKDSLPRLAGAESPAS